jgi:hypothetical protein
MKHRKFNVVAPLATRFMTITDSNVRLRLILVAALLLAPTAALAQPGSKGNPNPSVHPIGSKPYGLSYGEWSGRWWQWVLQIPPAMNPILDGIVGQPPHGSDNHCAQGQSGQAWFLPGTFGGAAIRTCTVPTGTSLFFAILNAEFGAGVGDCQTLPGPPISNAGPCDAYTFGSLIGVPALRAAAAAQMDNPSGLEADLDGVALADLTAYRAQSPVVGYSLTSDSLENLTFGFANPAGFLHPLRF